jgi:uncharacterized protein YjbI with pentapeptide repeats
MASATAGLAVLLAVESPSRTPVFHRWELFQLREASKATATCVAAAVCLNCYMFISGRVLDRGGFGRLDRAFPTGIPLIRISLSGIALTRISLSGIPLTRIALSGIPLTRIALSGIPLTRIALSGIPLTRIAGNSR